MPTLPGLTVLFQRPGDIVTSVRDGSLDFKITGWDVYSEHKGENGAHLAIATRGTVNKPNSPEEMLSFAHLSSRSQM